MTSQLEALSKPIPDKYIKQVDAGYGKKADYVSHSFINQKLLATVGAFDTSIDEIIRGFVPGIVANPSGSSKRAKEGRPALDNAIVAVAFGLTLSIDGEIHTIDEVGVCGDPHNWSHDGERLKDAVSDALKRAAMRFGVGLHLWSNEGYVLYEQLVKASEVTVVEQEGLEAIPVKVISRDVDK